MDSGSYAFVPDVMILVNRQEKRCGAHLGASDAGTTLPDSLASPQLWAANRRPHLFTQRPTVLDAWPRGPNARAVRPAATRSPVPTSSAPALRSST